MGFRVKLPQNNNNNNNEDNEDNDNNNIIDHHIIINITKYNISNGNDDKKKCINNYWCRYKYILSQIRSA